MATGFEIMLPENLMSDIDFLSKNAKEIFKGVAKAGAEQAAENMKPRALKAFKPQTGPKVNQKLVVTKPYITRNGTINCAARYYGYIPLKSGKQWYQKKNGKVYGPYPGVPAGLLVALADQGRSIGSEMPQQFRDYWYGTKYPIITPAFNAQNVMDAMRKAQEKLSGGRLKW